MARPKSRAEEILSSNEGFLGTKEAAAMLGVSVSTIHKMVEAGNLRAWRTQGGHRRIAAADGKATNQGGMQRSTASAHQSLSLLIVEDNATMVKAYSRAAAKWGDAVDVSAIAALEGGGGHRAAAGFTSHRTPDDIVALIRDAMVEQGA